MKQKDEIIKFIKFNIVGLSNTAIDFFIYILLRQVLGVSYSIASFLGYSAGVINSYFWNKKWTFKEQNNDQVVSDKKGQLIRFITINLVAFTVSLGILTLFEAVGYNKTNFQVVVGKIIATGVSLVINFLGSRLWVFKERGRV